MFAQRALDDIVQQLETRAAMLGDLVGSSSAANVPVLERFAEEVRAGVLAIDDLLLREAMAVGV